MRIRNLFLVCLLSVSLTVAAQASQEVEQKKKEINNIKKSSQYIYAEATAATSEEAREIAEEMLYQEINEWVATQKKLRQSNDIIISDKKSLWSTVSLPRGNMFRSFIYVKKSNIQSADNTEVLANANPVKDGAKAIAGKGQMTSSVESIDKPAYPEVVIQIAACADYAGMADMVKRCQQEGRVGSYARYAQLTKPEMYYLAIYNKAGKVVALLTPGATRLNVKTGKEDKIANYAGCGAIGFTVKQ